MSISTRQQFRRTLYPAVDALLGQVDQYASYDLAPGERAALVDCDTTEAYAILEDIGMEESGLLASLKYRKDTGHTSVGNFRMIDPENTHLQYHVHLFELEDGVEFNAHHEYRYEPDWSIVDRDEYAHYDPDLVPSYIPDQLVRSYIHYRGTQFYYDRRSGVTWLQSELDTRGVEYDDPPGFRY